MRNSAIYLQTQTSPEDQAATRCSFASGIDASSWLSWTIYLGTFWVALFLNPTAGLALRDGNGTAMALIVSIAFFFGSVLALQHHMQLSLTASSFGRPRSLTTSGVFRWSRNPIYVAFFIPLGALALLSPVASLIGLIAYVHVMTSYVIKAEERDLAAKFGADYAAYKARVPRWLAGL
ncbi:MAG: isoprenylcysteine carboxylmethyltransferase family protein [Pseudomonadota bacterium]